MESILKTGRKGFVQISFLLSLQLIAVATEPQTIRIDSDIIGRTYDGIGGVSAGASTRLLIDYPPQQQSDILNYLFKPNYGASMQILKVEIGGDVNATDGSEPSHMRTPDDLNCDRGYEWWLMKEAKARNPEIILMGLEWGVPGWMKGGFWSDDNIDYIIKWLDCAADKGFKIDYIGGWNERKFDTAWYIKMSKAVKEKYPHIRVIAADDCRNIWEVASVMRANDEFNAAVDVVGVHSLCAHRSQYEKCPSTPDAVALSKPLWASENSSQGHNSGAIPWARALNRMYIDGQVTAMLCWAPVDSWYANLPLGDTGIILAVWPWSGHYRIGKTVWVYAHTAQFVQPGWRYLDNSCNYLSNNSSFVALKSDRTNDYSLIIETLDTANPQEVRFEIGKELSDKPVHVWATDMRSYDDSRSFNQIGTIKPRLGEFNFTLKNGYLYTFTTTTGQKKGTAKPKSKASVQMSLPFKEDFESYQVGRPARFFSDLSGAFETAACGGARKGTAYRQCTVTAPVAWMAKREMPPTTLMGDPRWWGDYELSCDVFFEDAGFIELLARVSAQQESKTSGYHLRLSDQGKWQLYSQTEKEDIVLASGDASFWEDPWHKIVFRLEGSSIKVLIDGKAVADVKDGSHITGQIGLRTATSMHAQFDNISLVATRSAPKLLTHEAMHAEASSENPVPFKGWDHLAANVIDDRPETAWTSVKGLPQSITIDLGKSQKISGLLYWPALRNSEGRITKYKVAVSPDGKSFNSVAQGTWSPSSAAKTASWAQCKARFVKLEAVEGTKGMAAASEISIAISPL